MVHIYIKFARKTTTSRLWHVHGVCEICVVDMSARARVCVVYYVRFIQHHILEDCAKENESKKEIENRKVTKKYLWESKLKQQRKICFFRVVKSLLLLFQLLVHTIFDVQRRLCWRQSRKKDPSHEMFPQRPIWFFDLIATVSLFLARRETLAPKLIHQHTQHTYTPPRRRGIKKPTLMHVRLHNTSDE